MTAAFVPESGDRVDIYGKSATVISVGKRYVTVQIDGDEDGPSNWHPSYLKRLLPCGHKESDLTEGGQYGPFCAVCAVTKPSAREHLEKLVIAFHERWYAQLAGTAIAGTAIGEKQLGHEQSAERWCELDPETKGEWIEMAVEMQEAARLGPPYVECSCGYPKKECLRLVLRNGPPYPSRPCEPKS